MRSPNHPLVFLALALTSVTCSAEVRMPAIFGDHMVLQQNISVPVWGLADPGEKVTVSLGTKSGSATADAQGKWRVNLPKMTADGVGQTLEIKGKNTITFKDVLVGTVWIASGQSNMEFSLRKEAFGQEAIKGAKDPQIRMFFVPWKTSLEEQADLPLVGPDSLNAKWIVCSPETVAADWAWQGFSAVGYYFAKELRRVSKQPVGMIGVYKGGTPAEAWTSISGLKKDPDFAPYVEQHEKLVEAFPEAEKAFPEKQSAFQTAIKEWNEKYGKEFEDALKQWDAEVQAARAAGKPLPPRPQPTEQRPEPPPQPDGGYNMPANLFNTQIAPLMPYAIEGVIWYQGESNGDEINEAKLYRKLFPAMIKDWREKWGQGDFAFLFVQLANFTPLAMTPSEGVWPWVREAQLRALELPKTGMASAIDLGEADDIHPINKRDVGLRLALAARHVTGGEEIVFSGPIYKSMKVEGSKIRLDFTEAGGGLTIGAPPYSPDGKTLKAGDKLEGFGIAGEDQKFVWAEAAIDGKTVVVSSKEVKKPVAIRYDWANNPFGNLYNQEGLPASPFRTDSWDK